MGEKENALFERNVRSVIRSCAITTSFVWVPVVGAFGWWLSDLSSNVGYNTKSLAKMEVSVEFLVKDVKSKK